MTAKKRFDNRRNRTVIGLAVVAISIVLAVALAGLSFAAGNSPTAAKSPAANQYGGKITICHHTKSLKNPVVTIKIAPSAWPAHQKHGDTMGACTAQQIKHAKKVAHAKAVALAKAKKSHAKVVVNVTVQNGHGKAKGHRK